MQWLIVLTIALAILAAIFYFGRDITGAGGGNLSAPAATAAEVDPTLLTA